MFKLGVAGLGLGFHHAENILSYPTDWSLAAVCDPLHDRVRRFTHAHPQVEGFTDYRHFLDRAALDGVIIAVPHDLHAPLTIQALEAGKHVLIEKPMARTVDECRTMNQAATKAGRTLMVGQNWRYTPWVRAVKNVIDAGDLGLLRTVRTDWLQNIIGDTRPGNWLSDGQRAGGGPVISLIVHNLDCIRYLLGEPKTVHALSLTDHPAFTHHAENWAMIQFVLENGVIGQAFTGYSAFSPKDAGMLWVYGEEGTLYHTRDGVRISSARRGTDYDLLEIRDNAGLPTPTPSINEILHFVACARSGATPLSDGVDNLKTIRFIEAIYESARSGAVVAV